MTLTNFKAFVAVAILVFIDQFTKFIALSKLKPIDYIYVIDGILNFTFVENRGAAFGIFQGARYIFIILTIIIIFFIGYYFVNLKEGKFNSLIRGSLILITSGAIGNFIDRLFRGYVIDFIHITLINFPVFNFADICVVVGTIVLGIATILIK